MRRAQTCCTFVAWMRHAGALLTHACRLLVADSERLSVVLHDTVDTAVFGSRFPARLYVGTHPPMSPCECQTAGVVLRRVITNKSRR